jgi:hypothetical protein
MRDFTKSFSIDFQSKMDRQRYMGTFTVKKLTIGDLSRLGARKAQLSAGYTVGLEGGSNIDPGTAMLNEMIAHCEIALLSKPDWFDPEKIIDPGLLSAVYEEVAGFEANFLGDEPEAEGEGPGRSSEASGRDESEGTRGSVNSFAAVVDKKIPKISPLA